MTKTDSMKARIHKAYRAFIVKEEAPLAHQNVLDYYSYVVSNIILGNDRSTPVIEVRCGDVELSFDENTVISATGNGVLTVNGERMDFWRSIPIKSGSMVMLSTSSVAYLSVLGGFKLQGKKGIKLINLGAIDIAESKRDFEAILMEVPGRFLSSNYIPKTGNPEEIKIVLLGKSEESIDGKEFILYRNGNGHSVVLKSLNDNIKIAVLENGDVRVIRGEDGEYSVMAEILPCDFDKLARLTNGSIVRLKAIGYEDAKIEIFKYLSEINRIEKMIMLSAEASRRGAVPLRVRFNGNTYNVWVEEIE